MLICSCERGARFILLWVIALAVGCSLMPVDGVFTGRSYTVRFSENHYPYYDGEILFSHDVHQAFDCKTCHGTSTSREDVLESGLPPMKTCFECHDGVSQSQECETCHIRNRRERKPRFHTAQWLTQHKDMAYGESYKCSLCHAESECQQCHSLRKPRSHTLRFKRSTHGRFAIQDRQSCATCHETDFCVNCHSQAPPDHTPTFRAGAGHRQIARLKVRTCLTCHQFSSDCAECHP